MLLPRKKPVRKKRSRHRFPILFFVCSFAGIGLASGEEAIGVRVDRLIEAGREEDAKKTLEAWLLANTEDDAFCPLLARHFYLESDIAVLRAHLTKLLARLKIKEHAGCVWEKRAILEEMIGDGDMAQQAYQMAAIFAGEGRKAAYLLESARLLFEQGYLDKATEQLGAIDLLTNDAELRSRGAIIRAYLALYPGRQQDAKSILTSLLESDRFDAVEPQVLLALIGMHLESQEAYGLYFEKLKNEHPESPELALARRLMGEETAASFLLTPWRYLKSYFLRHVDLPQQPTQPRVSIQTGSFLVEENAVYMLKDLEAIGFSAEIDASEKDGKIYYRVVIAGLQGIQGGQEALRKLKQSGFDGYLIIDD